MDYTSSANESMTGANTRLPGSSLADSSQIAIEPRRLGNTIRTGLGDMPPDLYLYTSAAGFPRVQYRVVMYGVTRDHGSPAGLAPGESV